MPVRKNAFIQDHRNIDWSLPYAELAISELEQAADEAGRDLRVKFFGVPSAERELGGDTVHVFMVPSKYVQATGRIPFSSENDYFPLSSKWTPNSRSRSK